MYITLSPYKLEIHISWLYYLWSMNFLRSFSLLLIHIMPISTRGSIYWGFIYSSVIIRASTLAMTYCCPLIWILCFLGALLTYMLLLVFLDFLESSDLLEFCYVESITFVKPMRVTIISDMPTLTILREEDAPWGGCLFLMFREVDAYVSYLREADVYFFWSAK